MTNWFTVEKIDNDTYAISEYNHWEEPHCYLLCGTELAVFVDTGLGVANIREVVEELTKLPIQVVTTHAHWDHIGSHKFFDNIAVHALERAWLEEKFPLPLEVVRQNLMRRSKCCAKCRETSEEPCIWRKKVVESLGAACVLPEDFCAEIYEVFKGAVHRILYDGDTIDLGNRRLKVIHTPGHSPGHCCFYEEAGGYLFSGDLIYKGCLDAFYPTTDPIAFWKSIQKVQDLKVSSIFPGHHDLNVPVDIISRIEEAFAGLNKRGQLKQGNGVFEFEEFQIHL